MIQVSTPCQNRQGKPNLVEGGTVPLVCRKARELHQLIAIPLVLDSPKLQRSSKHLLHLLELGGVFLRDTLEGLEEVTEDDRLDLLEELGGLQSLAGNVQGQVVSCS